MSSIVSQFHPGSLLLYLTAFIKMAEAIYTGLYK